jgi:hypothetical protein
VNATAGDSKATDSKVGNTAVPAPEHGDHDRVQMLSLRADGTPDQIAPEMIGDKDAALAATTEQFKQQAVSAVDFRAHSTPMMLDGEGNEVPASEAPQDPSIAEAQDKHEEVAKAAESAAEYTVNALFKDEDHQNGEPADKPATKSATPPAPTADSKTSKA